MSAFSIVGLMAKFTKAWEEAGGTAKELNLMAEKPEIIGQTLSLLRGTTTMVVTHKPPAVKILELVNGEIKIPSLKKAFVAKDFFKVDISRKAKVKISFISDDFQELFGNLEIAPRDRYTVSSCKLLKCSIDRTIRMELGPVYETDLGAVRRLMEDQPNGEVDGFLNNDYTNIFYIRDVKGDPRAVCVGWEGNGWCVGARSIDNREGWDALRRVFSRDS